MGFVDVVGISTNYIKKDFSLNDAMANLLPMMVFLWFALLSVPTGIVMNKIGRKNTVLISMLITFFAMLVPFVANSFSIMLFAFALVGIGNTILQVSLNPLLTNIVSENRLTSTLTLGQFVKAKASFLGPIITTSLSGLWLAFTSIEENKIKDNTSSFLACIQLLKSPSILLIFLGILFVVGVNVGLNTSISGFLMERCNITLDKSGLGTSLYFLARTLGAFMGAVILAKMYSQKFFKVTMLMSIFSLFSMLWVNNLWILLIFIFILGFTIANVFSIIFSNTLKYVPERTNEISGLML